MKKYIIVTGGELCNKGAQAMSFITVDEMRKRYPDCEVVLISGRDYKRSAEEKSNYRFEIIAPPNIKTRIALCSNIFNKIFRISVNEPLFEEYKRIYHNAVAMIDISGFALSSKWKPIRSINYMTNIVTAKQLNIPSYLLPQSFGPFDFSGRFSCIANWMIRRYLKSCQVIMARENEGQQLLEERYKLTNVVRVPDLVLQNKGIDINNVYVNPPQIYTENIADNSVAVIPNAKNFKHGNKDKIMRMYEKMICFLLEQGKKVYLTYHALEDYEICEEIKKSFFDENSAVIVIEHEFSCLEYGQLVRKFDYIIASRYHSIINAYRQGVPAVVLGWATKYKELLTEFNQSQYQFDVCNSVDEASVMEALKKMNEVYKDEAACILNKLSEIQQGNVYDRLKF